MTNTEIKSRISAKQLALAWQEGFNAGLHAQDAWARSSDGEALNPYNEADDE